MHDVRMIYSEERGTWNVFADGEWYYEDADYERAERVFESFFWQDEDPVDEYEDDEERW